MDLLDLLKREHRRIDRELSRCIDGWQTFRPERREHAALESLRSYLVALERSLWPALIAADVDRANELACTHDLMHGFAARALRLCRVSDNAALVTLRETQQHWAEFARFQGGLHANLARHLTPDELREIAGTLCLELGASGPARLQAPSVMQQLWTVVKRSFVPAAPRVRELPRLTAIVET